MILVVDFGSQFTHLLARRIRDCGVRADVLPFHSLNVEEFNFESVKGIVFSGGPHSVYEANAPSISDAIFDLNIPILGVCYGMQYICKQLGGHVESSVNREYGKDNVVLLKNITTDLFSCFSANTYARQNEHFSTVWMSHGDEVKAIPQGFEIQLMSSNGKIAAFANTSRKIFGVQFHPEVVHTISGILFLESFLFEICRADKNWTASNLAGDMIQKLKEKYPNGKVLCALSGGVDSTVAAMIAHKAFGNRLQCIFVDHGLLRKNEAQEVMKTLCDELSLPTLKVDASEIFFAALKNIEEPEQKRKIIGKLFIDVFESESKKIENAKYLIQGTLYTDVIESVSPNGTAVTIKSHHNVGGLPEKLNLELIEPFRLLFKDEVRRVGLHMGISESIVGRHPFPGPGLAIRIPGSVTREKVEVLQNADYVLVDELKKQNLYKEVWQAFVVLLPVKSVGVMGDGRTFENVAAIRCVSATDGMTADWSKLSFDFLAKVSNRITNEVKGINRVVYDITSKPPATIEWE